MMMSQSLPLREAGVLLHISSLPSGNLGKDAFRFIDFLANTGARIWQTLPINMPHADNSPYQCISAHAGNIAFIALENLVEEGWLCKEDLHLEHEQALNQAYLRFQKQQEPSEFKSFCQSHAHWLDDFALYVVLRRYFGYQSWHCWDDPYKLRERKALALFSSQHDSSIKQVKFQQFLFFSQWAKMKAYAESKNIQLFGDVPIFVAYDSAEVWAKPHLFKLDDQREMTVVAGVPPDYFSETGQRWGNPHYNWQAMEKEGFSWWVERMQTQSDLFHLVRIDHFRGLEAAWEIPADQDTAMQGTWVKAPGEALLRKIHDALPNIQLIAEDLGIITEEVDALRLQFQLPGMKILQFAYGGDDTNPYLPENIDQNSVVYTGTHDNDTTLGWYRALEPHVRDDFHRRIGVDHPEMPMTLIKIALESVAKWAIVPMQDILELGSECRMNTPGTIEGNWAWRFSWPQLNGHLIEQFKQLLNASGRCYA